MGDPVEERRAVLRVERLMSLARWGKKTYLSRWVGREVFAVAEAHGENSVGAPSLAVTENYLKVELILNGSALLPKPGSSLRCRILAPPTRGELEGERRMSDADAEITEITT
jgi:threonylcarbamoyladenosine tRNA methylthiotransferase MtaB